MARQAVAVLRVRPGAAGEAGSPLQSHARPLMRLRDCASDKRRKETRLQGGYDDW
jgi:hypothetical protein